MGDTNHVHLLSTLVLLYNCFEGGLFLAIHVKAIYKA